MTERYTPHGSVLYKNEKLGVREGEYPRNSHFYEEGKEIPITRKGKPGLEVGYRDPMTVGARQQFTYQDSIVVFDGDNATTMVDKRTIKYKGDDS
jgi:hypothetical protein